MAGFSYGADPPPPLPPAASGGGATQAPPPPPPVASGRPPNTVRVNLTAFRNKGVARLYVAKGDGNYALVCQAPCKADVVPGTPLRVTYGSEADEGHDFNMVGTPGDDVDIEVKPPSKGALAGGIVLVSIGGVTMLFGLLFVAIGSSSGLRNNDDYKTGGWIATGIGAGLTVAGIVLLMNRSKEPRTTENEHSPNRSENKKTFDNKTDLFRSDIATLKPADPWMGTAAPPVIMPFNYAVSF
jgi:hypothetical protein